MTSVERERLNQRERDRKKGTPPLKGKGMKGEKNTKMDSEKSRVESDKNMRMENDKNSRMEKEKERENDKIENERRRRVEEEHQSMQIELMRTSEALETLQHLLQDRDKSSQRKEKLFIAEKELLLSETDTLNRAVHQGREEMSHLVRERDYMVRRIEEFGRQIADIQGSGSEGNQTGQGQGHCRFASRSA